MHLHRFLRAVLACLVVLAVVDAGAEESPGDSLLPDFYDDPALSTSGIKLEDFEHSTVDYFSGMMSRGATDFSLPGNGGTMLAFTRSYQSQQPYTWPERTAVGVGWNMHFGWVEIADAGKMCNAMWNVSVLDNPVLHQPDGSTDVLAMSDVPMADPTQVHYRGKSGMGIVCTTATGDIMTPFFLVGPDGTRYQLERWSGGGAMTGFYRTAKWFVKRITDRNGNWTWIDYADVGSLSIGTVVAPVRVTTGDGRDVTLEYRDGLLQRILYGNQAMVEYAYAPSGSAAGFFDLVRVTLRERLEWNYEYSAKTDPGAGSMTKAVNPFGGVTAYTWAQLYFQSGDGQQLNAAVTQVVHDPVDSPAATWRYAYAPARVPGERDVTTVTAPEGVYRYRHFSAVTMPSGEVWKVGLKERVEFTPNTGPVRSEEYTWAPYYLSSENYKRAGGKGVYAAIDDEYDGALLVEQKTTIGSKAWSTRNTDFWWGGNFLGVPQAQTIITTGPDGTQRTLNRRYEHRPDAFVYFLLHQEFLTQQLFPGLTPMSVDFDGVGNPVTRFDKGFYTFLAYDSGGNLVSSTRGLNGDRTQGDARVTQFGDYYRGVARRTDHPDGTTTLLEIDPFGRIVRKTNRDGETTRYAYDQLGRVQLVDYPLGNDALLSYDAGATTLVRGNYRRTTTIDGFGHELAETHDDLASGRSIRVDRRYDALGRTTFTGFPNSVRGIGYEYDDYGRVVSATHPGGTRRYRYADGSWIEVTDENGATTRLVRDELQGPGKGELVRIESPANIVTAIERNEYGLPLRISQGDGVQEQVRTRNYGSALVLTGSTEPETGSSEYGYDWSGNLVYVGRRDTPGSALAVQYNAYDANDRVVVTWAPRNEALSPGGARETYDVRLDYSYTPEGRPVDQSRAETVATWNGNEQLGALLRRSTWHNGYDANGNLVAETLSTDGHSWQFSYARDANDHLARMTYPDGAVIDYMPDAYGWPTRAGSYADGIRYHETGQLAGFTYGNGRQLGIALNDRMLVDAMTVPGVSALAYDYDPAGNLATITDARDATQNVSLRYDPMHRLVGADGPWGAGLFAYDATGNITRKSIGDDSLVLGYDERNRLASVSGSRNRQFAYDLFGNIARRGDLKLASDGLGNLQAVRNAGNGATMAMYQYDARGRRLVTYRNGVAQYSLYANDDHLLFEASPADGTWQRNIYVGAMLVARGEKFIACYEDVDGDGIPQCAEVDAGLDPTDPLDATGDRDGDGLTNLQEYQRGTGINDVDTDDDGMPDGVEVAYGLDPKVADADGDLDGDGLPNLVEFVRGFNPADPSDGAADYDGDGLSNADEYRRGTDWRQGDTDADGMGDGLEVAHGLNPLLDDAALDLDGDGIPNKYELDHGLKPEFAGDAAQDADNDGLNNLAEYRAHTDPRLADTDGDGVSDGVEVANRMNPLVNDVNGDIDGDGLPNGWELAHGLDPNNPADALADPDGDGMSILAEYRGGSDPFVADVLQPPSDVTVAPGTGSTLVAWNRDPLADGYSVKWGILGDATQYSAGGVQSSFSAATASDTLYWFQLHALRGATDLAGSRLTSMGGAGVDTLLPYNLSAGCVRTQLVVIGRGAFFLACEQNGGVVVYRYGNGPQPSPQAFPAGALQAGKSGWRFAATLSGNALYAWLDESTNTLMGARFDAHGAAWSAPVALESHDFGNYTTGQPCNDGDALATCRMNEIYTFDAYADWQGRMHVYYAVNAGYAGNGAPYYQFVRIPYASAVPGAGQGLYSGTGMPMAMRVDSPQQFVMATRHAGPTTGYLHVISLTEIPPPPGSTNTAPQVTGTLTPLATVELDKSWPSIDRQIVGWSNWGSSQPQAMASRLCGVSCTPMQGALESSPVEPVHAFGGVGDGQAYWYAPGAIRYSKVTKSSKGIYAWSRAANLVADANLADSARVRFARGESAAYLYWSNALAEIRSVASKADGSWTTSTLAPASGKVVDLDADWAGNAVLMLEKDGNYQFVERRRLPSTTNYQQDATPPVITQTSLRSGKTIITQVVTLAVDEPSNLYFSVTGGTIAAGGSNTAGEQRYTGPVTITFAKGGSATITFRGINLAERWSTPVSKILQ